MREIEIKLRVKNLEDIEKKLIESGLHIDKEISQHDTIYTNVKEYGGFENTKTGNIVLRIRKEGNDSKVTLKQQRTNEMDNIEYETEVKDPNEIHQMFLLLGWIPEVEVKKVRKKGKLGEYEICLDRVERLGDFIELEKMTSDDADPEQVRRELFKALEPFGLTRSDEETKGYDTLIYNLENK